MPDPRPVALDHNFPEPILKHFTQMGVIPEVRFHWIRELADALGPAEDGRLLFELDDHELVYELHRVLLRDLVPILRTSTPKGAMYNVKPIRMRPDRPTEMLTKLGEDPAEAIRRHGRLYAARVKYPDDDPRRLFPGNRHT